LTFPALEEELVRAGVRPVHTRALWRALHREAAVDLQNQDFLPPLRRWVDGQTDFFLDVPQVEADLRSSDGLTRKFLLRLRDGQTVETVLMGYPRRTTACVSTQAGCAMGCRFCATGRAGFRRDLRAGEIVAQVLHCRRVLESGPRNLVLMGMGEPLLNYDAVMDALEILTDRRGANIGPARVTISTVGVIPGILRLARENRPYALAVSLHAATDAERRALVPASRRWPLDDLLAACRAYCRDTGRRIFIEWTLIAGVNDTPEQAHRLAAVLNGMDAHVNLIPLNPAADYAGTPSAPAPARAFQKILQAAGYPSTLRQRRGLDIAAGCGQLKSLS